MKRIVALCLAMLFATFLSACGKKDADVNIDPNTTGSQVEEFEWSGIDEALQKQIILSKLDGEMKRLFLDECDGKGLTVVFPDGDGMEGATQMTDSDGAVTLQYGDGSIRLTNADGESMFYGYRWYVTETSSLIPEPKFGTVSTFMDALPDKGVIAKVQGVSEKNFTSYRDACKKMGFNDVTLSGESDKDEFIFEARKEGRWMVSVSFEESELEIILFPCE